MSISNHQNMQDVETYVAKVRKEMLAEGVRQRLEDQNEDQSWNKSDNPFDPEVTTLLFH